MPKGQTLPPTCPTQLGGVIDPTLPSSWLHHCARRGKVNRLSGALAQGAEIDTVNSLGQTPLYVASLFGHSKTVSALLKNGANPNYRCDDRSTPIHAACFSGQPELLCKLLQSGGDLRLHDGVGRTPRQWAQAAGTNHNTQMLEFLCCFQLWVSLISRGGDPGPWPPCPGSPAPLLHSSSSSLHRLQLRLKLPHPKWSSLPSHSFGFGRLYWYSPRHVGFLASTPIVPEKELVRADSETDRASCNPPYTEMCNLMWDGQLVTIRQVKEDTDPAEGDILFTEHEHASHLRHAHLLLLLGVSLSENLEHVRLVYERVQVGSLYTLLHSGRWESHPPHTDTIPQLLLQVCDAVIYLHSRGYIHRSLTSHAVQVVSPTVAKLCNLEYLQERAEDGRCSGGPGLPIPHQLYNWLPPEVIRNQQATPSSDLYSFCTVLQEALTDTVPWGGVDGLTVQHLLDSGHCLFAEPCLPKAYYTLVRTGLSVKPKDRSLSLQDLRYTLHQDVKGSGRVSGVVSGMGVPQAARSPSLYPRLPRDPHKEPDQTDGPGRITLPCQTTSTQTGSTADLCYYDMDLSTTERSRSPPIGEMWTTERPLRIQLPWNRDPSSQTSHCLQTASRQTDCHILPNEHHPPGAILTPNMGDWAEETSRQERESVGSPDLRERVKGYSVRHGVEFDVDSDSSLVLETITDSTCSEGSSSQAEEGDWAEETTRLEREIMGSPGLRERVRGYRMHHGIDFEVDSDSSLVLETITDSTCSEGSSSQAEKSCAMWVERGLDLVSPGPGSGSIQESACLLQQAHSSLLRLEERFLRGIEALQRFTSQVPASQDTLPQGASPQDNLPQGPDSQDNLPQVTLPQDNLPQGSDLQDNLPQVTLPQDNLPQGSDLQDNLPQVTLPQDNIPQCPAAQDTLSKCPGIFLQGPDSQDNLPQCHDPEDNFSQDTLPHDNLPQDTFPQDAVPQGPLPHDNLPQDTLPKDNLPQCPAPQDTVLQDNLSQDPPQGPGP